MQISKILIMEFLVKKSYLQNLPHVTARQNGFIYKVNTQAKDHQNLKVDTLSIQNSRKLKSYTVEFFSGKFLSAPTGIWTNDLQIWSPTLYHGAKRVRLFLQRKSKYINAIA